MALSVDIEKKLGEFCLKSKFTAGDETLAILGASGCGKSMTLKCIAGVETPDKGKIILDGTVLYDSEKRINLPARLRKTGYLFQNYALFPNMTVAENISCAVRESKEEKKSVIKEKIKDFHLEGLEKKYPRQLSGGQQQRVAIARMLASNPRLIMLDEPFSALDSFLKWQLEQVIFKVKESFSGTILFISHDRNEVFRLCDRVVAMYNGRTQDVAGKKEFFSDPQTLTAALLSGCKNISSAKKTGEHYLFAAEWNMQLVSQKPVPDDLRHTGVRAHYLAAVDAPGENTVECDVVKVYEDVFSTIVMAQLKGVSSQMRFEIDKEKWRLLDNPHKLFLHIPEDRILLLRQE